MYQKPYSNHLLHGWLLVEIIDESVRKGDFFFCFLNYRDWRKISEKRVFHAKTVSV